MNYLNKEGFFNDSKKTLKEDELKALKNNMNSYDEDFLNNILNKINSNRVEELKIIEELQ